MPSKRDCIKMFALGRNFTIGSLYNYVEDTIIPSKPLFTFVRCDLLRFFFVIADINLWETDDITGLTVVKQESKETVSAYKIAAKCEVDIDDEEEIEPWMSDIGLDDHSAMSLTAGLMTPSPAGAWQFMSEFTDWNNGSYDAQVAVHCVSVTRKISFNPQTQLQTLFNPDTLSKQQASEATHVVVGITYGLEAFCLFSHQVPKIEDKEDTQNLLDYANFFAKGLLDGREQLELDQDVKGDGHQLNVHCTLYSDLIGTTSGQTSRPIAEQYEVCRKLLFHQTGKFVALKVWLYPIHKLNPYEKMPDISHQLVIRCQKMWHRLRQVRLQTDKLIEEMDRGSTYWIPSTFRHRIKDFDGLLTKFAIVLAKSLREWIVSVRRNAGLSEESMEEMVKVIESNSPFVPNELIRWIKHQTQQLKTLKMLYKMPGFILVLGSGQLKREILNISDGFAVVLHLPSLADHSDGLVHEMSRFVNVFPSSLPASWTKKPEVLMGRIPVSRRRFVTAGQEFSDWITNYNGDATSVRYIAFYEERPAGQNLPMLKLYDCASQEETFNIPKSPGQVLVEKNRRGVITLSWPVEETIHLSSFLVQYQLTDGPRDSWDTIRHPTNEITINHLQSAESYVFRVAAVTLGGKSPFGPVSEELTIDPVCPPPSGLKCLKWTDTSITIAWNHQEFPAEEKTVTLKSFAVECWADGNQDSSFIQRSTTKQVITLEPIVPDTVYCVQIRAVCSDHEGSKYVML